MIDSGRSDSSADAGPSPWVYDLLLGCGVALIVSLLIASDVGQARPDIWAYLFAVVLGALMLLRRRFPVTILLLSIAVVIGYYAAGYPAIGVAVPVAAAAFSAAEQGRARVAIVACAAWLTFSVAYRLGVGQDFAYVVGFELPGHALLLAAAVAFGDSLRSRALLKQRADEIADLIAERYARDAERRVISERLAVARDLHDSVGHNLTVIALHTQVAEEAIGDANPAARDALSVISSSTASTLTDLRRTVSGLRSDTATRWSPLTISGLSTAVRPAEQAGMHVHTHVALAAPLPVPVETAVYRIVQEAITNVVRHSRASSVDVSVTEDDGRVRVQVRDDGRRTAAAGAPRVPAPPVHPGNGLVGMRERAELLDGTLTAGFGDSGFDVTAVIPTKVPSS